MNHLKEISRALRAIGLTGIAATLLYFNPENPYISGFAYLLLIVALFLL